MKKIYLLFSLMLLLGVAKIQAQDPFITTWKTTTADETITIPTTGTGYSYTVDWGDGSTDVTVYTGDATHQYTAAGTYTVSVTGDFPRIFFNNAGDRSKIFTVEQWGDIAWTSMESAFMGCNNLTVPATDAPDLSGVTSMYAMFFGTSSFNQPINHWDVSTITTMTLMFSTSSFNQPLGNWDVSNVTTMQAMFNSSSFNQDISNWDVSKVTNMLSMFRNTPSFNQDLSNWNVSKVTTMFFMFNGAASFNQSLAAWDISSITSMNNMLGHNNMSQENYEATLAGWATLDVGETQIPTGIQLLATGRKYCDATYRDLLIKATGDGGYGWTISEDGENCPVVLTTIGDKSVNEDEALNFTASATYAGSGTLTYSLDMISELNEMFIDPSTGAFSWTPDNFFVGTHSVTITVSDGNRSDDETITITVNNINDAPELTAIGNKNVDEDTELLFTASATDVDNTTLTYSIDATSSGKGMSINATTGEFSWTPTISHIGTHNTTISVSDGDLTDSEMFTITVNAVTSVDHPILAATVSIYPNPSSGKATLSLSTAYSGVLNICNMEGVILHSTSFENSNEVQVNWEGPAGMYLINLKTTEGQSAKVKLFKY